jgi:hypothetical protein
VIHRNSESNARVLKLRVLKEENVVSDGKENNTDNEWKQFQKNFICIWQK